MTPAPESWLNQTAIVNGVFKGGGAKGLLYAGALRALQEKGLWFRAVAGSSAGAITATLIAAGLSVDQLDAAVPTALSRLQRNYFGDLLGQPIVRTDRLIRWLEQLLVEQVIVFSGPRTSSGSVSFAELYAATGIELYVVCVDVAERQPIVFNSATTPTLSVAAATMASCSIPLAFRPGRLKVIRHDGTSVVHRLMDGGVWSNYPAFVFKDASFRAHHELAPIPDHSITIGFTVEEGPRIVAGAPSELLSGWSGAVGDRGAFLKGAFRYAPVRIYVLTVVPIVVALQAYWTIDRYGLLFLKDTVRGSAAPAVVEGVAGWFDGFFSHFYPGYISVLVVISLIAIGLSWIGATMLDSGVPAMRALMAVGTNVPYWVGTTASDHVVRLSVPKHLGTFSFRLKPELVQVFIAGAKSEAAGQLTTILERHR
jgi:predicted acylesterase/phospholipase RssA